MPHQSYVCSAKEFVHLLQSSGDNSNRYIALRFGKRRASTWQYYSRSDELFIVVEGRLAIDLEGGGFAYAHGRVGLFWRCLSTARAPLVGP